MPILCCRRFVMSARIFAGEVARHLLHCRSAISERTVAECITVTKSKSVADGVAIAQCKSVTEREAVTEQHRIAEEERSGEHRRTIALRQIASERHGLDPHVVVQTLVSESFVNA